jgi:signal transduction histidine kinase
VTKYGGTIDVNSAAGQGTTFTIKFPSTGKKDESDILI